ncbi:MAG: V-type ATP synthase subunit F [Nanoarchaeota archaeon]
MIVLANPEFATGFKLSGIKNSYAVKKREEALEHLRKVAKDEFIIANVSVIKLVPELEEFKNVVSIPDDAKEFSTTDDLKGIIKSAVGIELNI